MGGGSSKIQQNVYFCSDVILMISKGAFNGR